MTEQEMVSVPGPGAGDCGCDSVSAHAGEESTAPGGCGCDDVGRIGAAIIEAPSSRRGFLGRLGLLSLAGFATRFLPIGGAKSASAATCYSWVYIGCERYCDCNCNKANAYYVYRRVCCSGGSCWYSYFYQTISWCGNYCGPCGAYLGSC